LLLTLAFAQSSAPVFELPPAQSLKPSKPSESKSSAPAFSFGETKESAAPAQQSKGAGTGFSFETKSGSSDDKPAFSFGGGDEGGSKKSKCVNAVFLVLVVASSIAADLG
jgi:hypothetical protein